MRKTMQCTKEIEIAKSIDEVFFDTTIVFGTNTLPRLRYVACDDGVCIEEAFR